MCYFPSWDHLPTDGPTAQLMCNPNTAQFAYRQVFLFSSMCFVLEICVCTRISTNSRGTRERTYVQMDDACTVNSMQPIYEYGTSQSLCHSDLPFSLLIPHIVHFQKFFHSTQDFLGEGEGFIYLTLGILLRLLSCLP